MPASVDEARSALLPVPRPGVDTSPSGQMPAVCTGGAGNSRWEPEFWPLQAAEGLGCRKCSESHLQLELPTPSRSCSRGSDEAWELG